MKDTYYPSVTAKNCVKLRRVVEMYQWVEHEHEKEKDGHKKKEYTYWSVCVTCSTRYATVSNAAVKVKVARASVGGAGRSGTRPTSAS